MKFDNLDAIAKALEKELMNSIGHNDQLRQVVGQVVSENVKTDVFGAYPYPQFYNRRTKGGLDDPNNIERVALESDGKNIKLTYENTTEGVDNLQGKSLTDVIESGDKSQWANPDGAWSEPRPFIAPSISELESGDRLRDGLVDILKSAGLDVK